MQPIHTQKITTLLPFTENIVFIDGITRAGKFWVGNVLNHFANVDQFGYDHTVDFVSMLAMFGGIEENAAITLLRAIINIHVYDNRIGRHLNMRIPDSSSVIRNPTLAEYWLRMAQPVPDQQQIVEDLRLSGRVFPFIVHDCLVSPGIALGAFSRLKMLRIERNPVDLVFAWHSTGLGKGRMFFSHRVDGPGGSVPWFASQWAEEFDALCEMDRIIRCVLYLDRAAKDGFALLSQTDKERVLFTAYENLGADPEQEVRRIGAFLGTEPLAQMSSFCAGKAFKERSRERILAVRGEKLQAIRGSASAEAFQTLLQASQGYEATVAVRADFGEGHG